MVNVRRDALPDTLDYTDDGCAYHPSCLACPLPRCRYEDGAARYDGIRRRNKAMRIAYARGTAIRELVRRHGLSKRSVYRIIHRTE